MRRCSVCNILDRAEVLEEAKCNCQGGDIFGHTTECQKIAHFVVRNIKPHEGPLTQKMRRQGWQEWPRGLRGKPAVARLICRDCIRKTEEVADIAAFKKKVSEELDESKPLNMYQILSL